MIADFPAYAVSDLGRVKRVEPKLNGQMRRDPILKLIATKRGYHQVGLWRDGKLHAKAVHRLVCAAFHGPPPTSQHAAAHGDGNGQNNAAGNLRWATPTQNEHDKRAHGSVACGERQGSAKLTEADVRAIRADRRSSRIIGADYGISGTNVLIIQRGEGWRHVT